MKHKENSIKTLEAIAHWMRNSTFDYTPKDLATLLNDAFLDYKKYLKEK